MNGRQFAAWLGLTPSQSGSGGKTKLGRITRRGDDYLRTLLVQGARSVLAATLRKQRRESPDTLRIGHRITGDRTQAIRGIGQELLFVAVVDHSRTDFTRMYPHERKASAMSFVQASPARACQISVGTPCRFGITSTTGTDPTTASAA